MKTRRGLCGEFWSAKKPEGYQFSYFKYTEANSKTSTPARLSVSFKSIVIQDICSEVMELSVKYPYAIFELKSSFQGSMEISIEDFMLFDFDLSFAKDIERVLLKFERKGKLLPLTECIDWDDSVFHKRNNLDYPVQKNYGIKGVKWIVSEVDQKSGLESSRLRIDMSFTDISKSQEIINKVCDLSELCGIQYVEFRHYRNNFMFMVGNGRQGKNGKCCVFSDFEAFKDGVLSVLDMEGVTLGFKMQNGASYEAIEYSQLINAPRQVLKDDRENI